MLWKASGCASRAACARLSRFDLISNSGRVCLCVCVCVHRTDTDDVCKCVCHMPGQPTPPGCVGGDTLHSVWHAAGCPGLSRGSGGDRTMMCFMGHNVDAPSSPYSTPRPLRHLDLLNVVTFPLRPFVFGLTVGCPLLPTRSRMWTPASVSWTPKEWTYKGSQQKVRRKRVARCLS